MVSNGNGISVVDMVLWPARKFEDTRDFVSRIPSAGLSITLIGQILSDFGLSPAVASAVSILGLATVFTEVGLKVVFNTKEPFNYIGLRNRAGAFLIYFTIGLGYFIFYGPGTLQAPVTSVVQFVLGLGITYVAGTVFMTTWRVIEQEDSNVSFLILGSMLFTIGFVVTGFFMVQHFSEVNNVATVERALFMSPENVSNSTNASIISTNPVEQG